MDLAGATVQEKLRKMEEGKRFSSGGLVHGRAHSGIAGGGVTAETGFRQGWGPGGACSDSGSVRHLWPQRGLDSRGPRVEGGKDRLNCLRF